MKRTVAIITAGGSGTRINSEIKKQFIQLKGRPVLFWTLDKFAPLDFIDKILVVLPESALEFCQDIRSEFPQTEIVCIKGGKERQDSVYNALLACPADTDLVLIHDGVRPFITISEITSIYQEVLTCPAVIAVSPVKNTIKSVTGNIIKATVPREDLFNALTPQAFQYKLLLSLHEKARREGLQFTDDAAILGHYGRNVKIQECSSTNIKITDDQDLFLAKLLLENT